MPASSSATRSAGRASSARCLGEPHTWMDEEDIEYAKDVKMPKTPEDWKALAKAPPVRLLVHA